MSFNHDITSLFFIRNAEDEKRQIEDAQKKGIEWIDGTEAINFFPSLSDSFKSFPYYLTQDLEGDLSWKLENEVRIDGLSEEEEEDEFDGY